MNIELIKSLLTLRTGIAFIVGILIGWIIITKIYDWRKNGSSRRSSKAVD